MHRPTLHPLLHRRTLRRARGAARKEPMEGGRDGGNDRDPAEGKAKTGPGDSEGTIPGAGIQVHERHGRPVGPADRPGAAAPPAAKAAAAAILPLKIAGSGLSSREISDNYQPFAADVVHVVVVCLVRGGDGRIPERFENEGRNPAYFPKEQRDLMQGGKGNNEKVSEELSRNEKTLSERHGRNVSTQLGLKQT